MRLYNSMTDVRKATQYNLLILRNRFTLATCVLRANCFELPCFDLAVSASLSRRNGGHSVRLCRDVQGTSTTAGETRRDVSASQSESARAPTHLPRLASTQASLGVAPYARGSPPVEPYDSPAAVAAPDDQYRVRAPKAVRERILRPAARATVCRRRCVAEQLGAFHRAAARWDWGVHQGACSAVAGSLAGQPSAPHRLGAGKLAPAPQKLPPIEGTLCRQLAPCVFHSSIGLRTRAMATLVTCFIP